MSAIQHLSPHLQVWGHLNPVNCQFLLCDLQDNIVPLSNTNTARKILNEASNLCELAKLLDIPVTFSLVPFMGETGSTLHPQFAQFSAGSNQLTRIPVSAFLDPATKERLARQNRRTLIIAGVVTEGVVLHTALAGLTEGYEVIVAVDACGGITERTESAAIQQLQLAGALVLPILSLGLALAPDLSKPEGQQALGIVTRYLTA